MNTSIQREIKRIEKLGEKVEVTGNHIIIYIKIIPKEIGEAFAERIKKVDIENQYTISVQEC
ncbi:MAG: hypothetical protein HYT65_02230 [Candidatus Yanofskybacteria bacterium]|nr:hypothetical protein [Candidatus Yanofskybacteria bacterium]